MKINIAFVLLEYFVLVIDWFPFQIRYKSIMPALDINMIESLSRELHPPHTNLMSETEVSPEE